MTVVLYFLLGLCVGSFLNVLADRLPREENVLIGRSHCDFCKRTLRWFELIPVISYILQLGRCRRCHKKLSLQYPVVELVAGTGFVLLPYQYWLIFSSLLVIFIADLKYEIIPDSMVVVGVIGSAITGLHLLPGLVSFAFIYLLWALTRGRGMGFGDVKFAGLMGLFLGYPNIVIAFYIAFLTGAVVGVILVLRGKKGWKSHIAFGPFLVAGTWLAFVWGSAIFNWWKGIL